MSKDEFFAFMPLLIYGIAVSELVMHWRDYLKADRRYWPHLLTGLVLLELAFSNFYYLYDYLDQLFINYGHFLMRLTSPLVFLLMVSVYTPEDNRDIKAYFHDKMSTVFSLLAVFIFVNLISDSDWSFLNLIRIIAILFCLAIAYFKKIWIFWVFLIFRITLFIVEMISPQVFA